MGDPAHNDGLRYVGAGMGFNPINKHTFTLKRLREGKDTNPMADDILDAERTFDKWNEDLYNWCEALPSSYQFLKNTIYKE